jgi:hypothetical protein
VPRKQQSQIRRIPMRPILTIALALALVMAVCGGCSSDTASSPESGNDTASSPESGKGTDVELENPQVRITIEDNTQPSQGEDAFTPVTVSFVGADSATPVLGSDGRYRAVYELILTNTKPVPASLDAVDVLDAANDTKLLGLKGEDLIDNLRTLDVQPVEGASLPPNESRLLYISAVFDTKADIPDALEHRIEVKGADNPGATKPTPLSYKAGYLPLSKDSPPVFSPPLAGQGWIAINGCCGLGHPHRESVQSVNGKLYNSQRFAVDFMRLDSDGRLVEGDTSKNSNFVDYGAPVMAAGGGVVVSTLDKLEDNEPGALPDPSVFTELGIVSVDGNHVVIDHGNGLHSFYAHLQKGSIKVKVGDEVQAGEELGLLGNTGNSSAPHMHFHVMNGPSPLGAEGVPYVFDSFQLAGVANPTEDEFDKALFEGAATFPSRAELDPVEHRDEMPLDNAIMDFPSE